MNLVELENNLYNLDHLIQIEPIQFGLRLHFAGDVKKDFKYNRDMYIPNQELTNFYRSCLKEVIKGHCSYNKAMNLNLVRFAYNNGYISNLNYIHSITIGEKLFFKFQVIDISIQMNKDTRPSLVIKYEMNKLHYSYLFELKDYVVNDAFLLLHKKDIEKDLKLALHLTESYSTTFKSSSDLVNEVAKSYRN